MHGGDIYRNKVELDFSVNINPLGIPGSIRSAWQKIMEDCFYYPDIRQEELRRAISRMTGAKPDDIVCANGASELFPAMIRACGKTAGNVGARGKVFIPVPAFSGYERAVKADGREIVYYKTGREEESLPEKRFCLDHGVIGILSEDIGMVILANPNNPVGNLVESSLLEELVRECLDRKIIVVLDECFIEFVENSEAHSFLHKTERYPNLIVVRSFTKIFAIPGLRLGYMVCSNAHLKELVKEQLPEWNVSAPAQRAGVLAAAESDYIEKSKKYIADERKRLRTALSDLGFMVYPGEANYLLFHAFGMDDLHDECLTGMYHKCGDLYDLLLERGILIRDCSDYRGLKKGYYRVAVKKREENDRLIRALKDIV